MPPAPGAHACTCGQRRPPPPAPAHPPSAPAACAPLQPRAAPPPAPRSPPPPPRPPPARPGARASRGARGCGSRAACGQRTRRRCRALAPAVTRSEAARRESHAAACWESRPGQRRHGGRGCTIRAPTVMSSLAHIASTSSAGGLSSTFLLIFAAGAKARVRVAVSEVAIAFNCFRSRGGTAALRAAQWDGRGARDLSSRGPEAARVQPCVSAQFFYSHLSPVTCHPAAAAAP